MVVITNKETNADIVVVIIKIINVKSRRQTKSGYATIQNQGRYNRSEIRQESLLLSPCSNYSMVGFALLETDWAKLDSKFLTSVARDERS